MTFLDYFKNEEKDEYIKKINGLNIEKKYVPKFSDLIKERIKSYFFSTEIGKDRITYYIVKDDNGNEYKYNYGGNITTLLN